jgi:hypothetical protein
MGSKRGAERRNERCLARPCESAQCHQGRTVHNAINKKLHGVLLMLREGDWCHWLLSP